IWAEGDHGATFDAIGAEEQAVLRNRLERELRRNDYDAATSTLVVSEDRAKAIARVAAHYDALVGGDPSLASLREDYAMQEVTIADAERRARLSDFFFWTSWACVTERPGSAVSYTNNWPHEPLVGNRPTSAN